MKWIQDKIGLPPQAQGGLLLIFLGAVAADLGSGLIIAFAIATSGMFLLAYASKDLM